MSKMATDGNAMSCTNMRTQVHACRHRANILEMDRQTETDRDRRDRQRQTETDNRQTIDRQ